MSTQPRHVLSTDEYLAFERQAEYRSEFLGGEMQAMAGASPRHVLIVTNLVAELRAALRDRPCAVFSTDLRLQVQATGLFTYPDVMVTCGEIVYSDAERDTVLNPCLIVEVLSASTQDYDRGGKFAHYRALPSVVDYLLVAQDRIHVELLTRQADDRWLFTETDDGAGALHLQSVGFDLSLREVYHKVGLLGLAP